MIFFVTETSEFKVDTVRDGIAKLPCNVTPSIDADKMQILIWFKESSEGSQQPAYT